MGKSSGGTPPPPEYPAPPEIDIEALMGPMVAMMEKSMEMQSEMMMQMSEPILPPPLPEYQTMDWAEKEAQIAASVKADFTKGALLRKDRQSTILTSPLLDDEDATTTNKSILAG